jgi:hypothetical protein
MTGQAIVVDRLRTRAVREHAVAEGQIGGHRLQHQFFLGMRAARHKRSGSDEGGQQHLAQHLLLLRIR